MGDRLKGKVAVVTGAGRGVGRAIAMALADQGAKVVVDDNGCARDGTGFDKGPADEVVAEIKRRGGKAVAVYEDVATTEGGNNIIKTAIDKFGKIDILVNNAGFLRDRMVFNMTPEEWDGVIKSHLYGNYNCARAAAPLMRQQRGGRIINISSGAGIASTGQANYGAAKEGIIGLTRSLARDLGRYGVTVNAIRPNARTRMSDSPEMQEALRGRIARGEITEEQAAARRPPDPEDIGPFAVWLCTDAASDINGNDFRVSGGHIGLLTIPTEIKTIDKEGRWTLEELDRLVPKSLAQGLVNPAPPQPPSEKK